MQPKLSCSYAFPCVPCKPSTQNSMAHAFLLRSGCVPMRSSGVLKMFHRFALRSDAFHRKVSQNAHIRREGLPTDGVSHPCLRWRGGRGWLGLSRRRALWRLRIPGPGPAGLLFGTWPSNVLFYAFLMRSVCVPHTFQMGCRHGTPTGSAYHWLDWTHQPPIYVFIWVCPPSPRTPREASPSRTHRYLAFRCVLCNSSAKCSNPN